MGMSNMQVQQPMQQGGGKGFSSNQTLQSSQPKQSAPTDVAGLYQQVLGRTPEAEGLSYWNQKFGETIEPNEIQEFTQGAQTELQGRNSGQPRMGQPNPYSNTAQPWDNASIMPQQSGGKGGKGGSFNSYPTAATNFQYNSGQTRNPTTGKSGGNGP